MADVQPALSLPGDLLDILKGNDNNLLDLDSLADFLDEPFTLYNMNNGFVSPGQDNNMLAMTNHSPLVTNHSGDGHATAESSDQTVGGGGDSAADGYDDSNGRAKKKRTRNQTQMEMNRVAQQKYRERKKAEHQELQNAVDMLTAQLAAMKAIEARNGELEVHARNLSQQLHANRQRTAALEQQVDEQSKTIISQAGQLAEQQALLTSQQKMILDQHTKLQLQEEIIASLKERVKESVDQAWDSLENKDPSTVCRKMHEAVRAALMDAKDMEGLQDTLARIPDHLVVEICKNILCACKDMWPQITSYMKVHCPLSCAAMAGQVA